MKTHSLTSLLLALFLAIGAAGSLSAQEADAGAGLAAEAAADEASYGAEAVPERALKDWYEMGGLVMHGLVLLSALALALIFERMIALRRGRIIPRKFMAQVMEPWRNKDLSQVLRISSEANNSMARVLSGSTSRMSVQMLSAVSACPPERHRSARARAVEI